jgi:hypothetical protein
VQQDLQSVHQCIQVVRFSVRLDHRLCRAFDGRKSRCVKRRKVRIKIPRLLANPINHGFLTDMKMMTAEPNTVESAGSRRIKAAAAIAAAESQRNRCSVVMIVNDRSPSLFLPYPRLLTSPVPRDDISLHQLVNPSPPHRLLI